MLRRICHRNFCTCSPRPWLFVGLGNPGDKYKGMRHNVGFEMLDAFADSQGIHMETVHCKAMFGKGFIDGIPVLSAKPLTYMNLSGESVEECDLSFSWKSVKDRYWKTSWSDGFQSIHASKVQFNCKRMSDMFCRIQPMKKNIWTQLKFLSDMSHRVKCMSISYGNPALF